MKKLFGCRKIISSGNDLFLILFCGHYILVVLGLVGLSYFNLKKGTELAGSDISLDVILTPESEEAQRSEVLAALQTDSQVLNTQWISPERLWEEFLQTAQINTLKLKQENIFPPIIEVTLNPALFSTTAQVQMWAAQISKLPGVQTVQGSLDWFANYLKFFQFLKYSGAIFVLGVWVLGFALMGLIYSYSVLRQKEVIEIQSLVGATPAFVFRPILKESILLGSAVGVSAGLLCLLLFRLGHQEFAPALQTFLPLPQEIYGSLFIFILLLSSSLIMSVTGCVYGFWRVQSVLRGQEFSS
jgi:cell division protein FtsX